MSGERKGRADPFDIRPIELQKGKYAIDVHVIEAKDILTEDGRTILDPTVEVDVDGDKRATRTLHKVEYCVYDERFHIENEVESDIAASDMTLTITLWDSTGFAGLRRNVVGAFSAPVAWFAAQKNRELHRRWFGLERPGTAVVHAKVRLSVSVQFGRHSAPSHNDDELSDDELIVTPAVRRKSHLVLVRVHRAAGLPKLDLFGSIDPYVEISHGRESVRTSLISRARAPVWEQQLELPYVVPANSAHVTVMLWDGDVLGREPIGAVLIPFDEIVKQTVEDDDAEEGHPPRGTVARWYYFYGAPPLLRGRAAYRMNTGKAAGIAFRGRVLLTVWAKEAAQPVAQSFELPLGRLQDMQPKRVVDFLGNTKIEANRVPRTIRNDPFRADKLVSPPEDEYVLRVWLFAGAYLPGGPLSIEVEFGGARFNFGTRVSPSGEYSFKLAREEKRRLPDDPRQLPDVFVYLVQSLTRTGGRPVRVAYLRYAAVDLLQLTDKPWEAPKWTALRETQGFGAFSGAGEGAAGYLLLGVLLRRARETAELPFAENLAPLFANPLPFELVFRLYLGRNLPAADETGSLDPYVRLHCGGRSLKTELKKQTSYPKWYTQYSMQLSLPRDNIHLGPLVLLFLWDHDAISRDERVGRAAIELASLPRSLADEEIKEADIHFGTPGDLKATLVCSLTLVPLSPGYQIGPRKSIELRGEPCIVEVIAVGGRGLEPRVAGRLSSPYSTFDLGAGGDYRSLVRTTPSKVPSAASPNYLEVIRMREKFPSGLHLAPALSARLIDPHLGGLVGTQIGQSALELSGKLPWVEAAQAHAGKPTGLAAADLWVEQLDAALELINSEPAQGGAAGGRRAWRIGDTTRVYDLRMQALRRNPLLASQIYTIHVRARRARLARAPAARAPC